LVGSATRVSRAARVAAQAPVEPPFTECPPVGLDTSCGILLKVTDAGTTVLQDSTQPPYDGIEDTLIGVVNLASRSLASIALSSNTNLFGFDGDGLCAVTPRPAGCPFGPTGYEGPNTSFSGITPNASGGVVNFNPPLGFGETAYFSLEQALSATQVFSGGPGVREAGGAPNPSEHLTTCFAKDPVNCATGQLVESFTDASVPGRGVALGFQRTYISGAAATDGRLGFGWTDNYDMSLSVDPSGNVTVTQENGSTVDFTNAGGGSFIAPPRVLATLEQHGDGSYSFTRKTTNVRYDFTAGGRLTTQVDRNGYATTLSYTGDQLAAVTDPAGRSLTFTYSGSHLSAVRDPLGRTVTFSYDAAGNLTTATDPAGRTQGFTYDPSHLLLTITDRRGGETTITYDGSGRVVSQTDPVGLKQTFAYSGDPAGSGGGKTTMTDAHGNVTTYDYANLELLSVTRGDGTPAAAATSYTYDPATLGRTTITDPLGRVTTNTFDGDGNLLTTTDPAGHTSSFTYNGFDELTSKTTPLGETTSFAYDGRGNLLAVTDPLGNTTSLAYADSAHPGDLTSTTDPDGRVTTLAYDGFGNLASRSASPHPGTTFTTRMMYDADGERTCQVTATANAAGVDCPPPGSPHTPDTITWEYDAVGQLVAVTDPNGQRTAYDYDGNGNRTKTTDPDGNVATTTYDGLDRPTATSRGATATTPSTTHFAHDLAPGTGACGSGVSGATYCSTVTDPNGHVSVEYFSARDQLLAETRPDNKTTSHSYDLAGKELTRNDPAGRTLTIAYDAADRVTSLAYSDGETANVSYDYDADGRRTAMSDGTGTSTYTYDAAGRYLTLTNGAGATVGYGYDGAGNVTTLTYPNGKAVTRSFDGAGRMASITDWLGHTTSFGYDPNGNQTTIAYPNGDMASSTYDATDRMTGTTLAGPSSTLASITYTRDPGGLVTKEIDSGALTGSITYAYDAKSQLASVNGSSHDYDLAGNPTKLAGGITQIFDAADQLTSSNGPGGTTTYSFDNVGNRIAATAPNGATTSYGYDQASRLATVALTTQQPAVTTISPASGPRAGGTAITITGTGFTGATSVTVGGKTASFRVDSDTSISATTPPGRGTVDVVVTTPAGSSPTGPADQFTYVSVRRAPRVTRVAPNYGPTSGGVRVMITGSRFTGARVVRFGTRRASFRVKSATRIVAWAPPGRGTVHVRVTTRKGTSPARAADRFTYVPGPGIYFLEPTSGPAEGGTKVSIIGFNFQGATKVRFGHKKARFHPYRDGDKIIANSPAGGGTVHVRVTTPKGISAIVPGDQYTYTGRTGGAEALRSEARSAAVQASYAYNGDGLRMSKTVNGTTTAFAWDEAGAMPLLLNDGDDSYIYGPAGQPIEKILGDTATYLHQDQLGSTRLLTDQTGQVVGDYTYDAGGKTISHSGPATTPLQHAGQYADEETGLRYLRARYYDPQTAQFLSVDPLHEVTRDSYGYASNNPVNLTDASGLDTLGYCGNLSLIVPDPERFGFGSDYFGGGACLTRTRYTANDEIGLTGAFALATGGGLKASASVTIQVSNAPTLGDLRGQFWYATVGGQWGVGITGTLFWNDDLSVFGLEIGPSFGGGAGGAIGASWTGVHEFGGWDAWLLKRYWEIENLVNYPILGVSDLLHEAFIAINRIRAQQSSTCSIGAGGGAGGGGSGW
jgi:RHS repeat-associated protein